MGTAKVIYLKPRAGLARAPLGVRRPLPALHRLQAKLNDTASRAYWWGVQDTAPYIAVSFFAGMCIAFLVVAP